MADPTDTDGPDPRVEAICPDADLAVTYARAGCAIVFAVLGAMAAVSVVWAVFFGRGR